MPKPRSKLAEVLAALRSALDDLGVAWYLFGAQAALHYGGARLTADIDATVKLDDKPTQELIDALRPHGFESRISDPEFVRTTRVLPFVHVSTRFPTDLVLAGPGLEELFVARALERTVAGVRIPVARPEDIIVMKTLAARDKDRADIEAVLLAQRDTIDLGMIRDTLRLLESALDQSDLLPAFEQALRNTAALG